MGASAYAPRVMLKIVLLAYSQGLISSRVIAQTVHATSSSSPSAATANPATPTSPSSSAA
ncbi:transposase [Rhodoferax fermentans]|uniref:transposase n=1 Tax=Rhodoferax fermentans TaxID=28066 RepID=UPI003CC81BB3